MVDKDVKKLSRSDLLEMLIAQSEELAEVKEKLAVATAQLNERHINIEEAGSIAEAALQLNGVFAAAEAAGQQYLENIKRLSLRQGTICAKIESESKEKAQKMLAETEEKCAKLEAETKQRCAELVENAKRDTQVYWNDIRAKLDNFYNTHAEIKELLNSINPGEK